MPVYHTLLAVATGSSDAVLGAGLAVVTLGIVFAALLAIGFAILVRRGRSARRKPHTDHPDQRANIALVRLDDEVAATADELGFAIAQFGRERAASLETALEAARANLASAFALKQQLDDAIPDTATQQREWTARVLMLCEATSERLATERTVFDGLRALERSAPQDLELVRGAIGAARDRLPAADTTLRSLAGGFAPGAIAPVSGHVPEAARLLDSASRAADDAARQLDEAGAVSASIQSADRDARRATGLLDELERHASALAASSARLKSVAEAARATVARAKAVRDTPPDPATGAAVADAIAWVERTLTAVASKGEPADPDAAIARIEATTDALDAALAGARNQEQRLAHARDALSGALLTARSQIETTRAYIGGRRGGAGAEARTRLAEAERLLAIAEAEADPVVALDTARSSATYSRDADALARYDLLH